MYKLIIYYKIKKNGQKNANSREKKYSQVSNCYGYHCNCTEISEEKLRGNISNMENEIKKLEESAKKRKLY